MHSSTKSYGSVAKSKWMIVITALVLFSIVFGCTTATYSSTNTNSSPTPSKPVNLSSDSPTEATNPIVASAGSHVYVAWSEGSGGIKFRSSSDYGLQWSPPPSSPAMNVSKEGGPYGAVQFPVMAANSSDVFIVWSQEWGSLGLEIFEATSMNEGSTFTVTQLTFTDGRGNATAGGYIIPAIAASGQNAYVTFAGNGSKPLSPDAPNIGSGYAANSYVMSSNNFGETWSKPHNYSHSVEDEVAAWGNDAYAVSDHTLAVSHNDGKTWTVVRSNSTFKGDEPMIAAYGQYVYVVTEFPLGLNRNQTYIRAYISNDNGKKFSAIHDLSVTLNDSWAPMVGAYGSSAWVALRQYPGSGKGQVWVYTTANGGQNWTGPISLSGKGKPGSAETYPFDVVSTDGQHVFVGWAHQVKRGYWTFMVSASGDGGETWTAPPGINVSQNKNGEAGFEIDLANAAISSSGPYCYAVWQFESGRTNQIFFASLT